MEVPVPGSLVGERIDRAVALLTGCSRSEVTALVEAGAVFLDGEVVSSRTRKLAAGELLRVELPDADGDAHAGVVPDPSVEVDVVHADDHVVVVDKPAGVVVHPGAGWQDATLVHGLVARFPEIAGVGQPGRPGIVHRLDAGTSGLMVVARSTEAYDALVTALAARHVDRTYTALVWGHLASPRGVVDAPIGRSPRDRTRMAVTRNGRPARTQYHVERTYSAPAPTSLLGCRLETGRTHQIRVHLSSIGHPVVGDDRYRGSRPALALDRPFLHARRLGFHHPVSGERLVFDSELPPDLADLLSLLERAAG